MTAIISTTESWNSRLRYLPFGIAASIAHMLMMIPGYREDGDFQTVEWLSMLALSLLVAAVLFIFVVPRTSTMWALVLAIVAVVLVAAFWAGLTLPVAAAAALIAWRARQRGETGWMPLGTLAISAAATAFLVAVIIGDQAA